MADKRRYWFGTQISCFWSIICFIKLLIVFLVLLPFLLTLFPHHGTHFKFFRQGLEVWVWVCNLRAKLQIQFYFEKSRKPKENLRFSKSFQTVRRFEFKGGGVIKLTSLNDNICCLFLNRSCKFHKGDNPWHNMNCVHSV